MIQGRFGNNVFQMMAAEIIRTIYSFGKIQYVSAIPPNAQEITDDRFIQMLEKHNTTGERLPLDSSRPVVLNGFFQRTDLFTPYRKQLQTWFHSNCIGINSSYSTCDIVKHRMKKYPNFDAQKDLVLHVRLDDYKHEYGLINVRDMIETIIKPIEYRKLYIVCDSLRQAWEKEYMNQFSELRPVFTDGTLLDDWLFLKHAKKIVASYSTFAWTAAFLGDADEVHIPAHPRTHLRCFMKNCKLYRI
jgi:hypothetical protein